MNKVDDATEDSELPTRLCELAGSDGEGGEGVDLQAALQPAPLAVRLGGRHPLNNNVPATASLQR
jgi:hypothetical protein